MPFANNQQVRRVRKQKPKILQLHNHKCFYCNKTLDTSSATMDHFYPTSTSRDQHSGNHAKPYIFRIVPACESCNKVKGNRLPTPEEISKFDTILKDLDFDPVSRQIIYKRKT